MQALKIGIIREGKVPPDNRTPLTPRQCHALKEKYPQLQIFAEWSAVRCYTDEDYRNFGVEVVESLEHCDLLLGIKEVPVDKLIPNKTYMFFSHTIKKQPYNRNLLQTILQKNIRLIDLELLTDDNGNRLIGFGRWAGIVGAHHALLMLGKRTGLYHLKSAKECINLQELVDQYDNIQFPPAKFVITGGGRVANGALEIMIHAGIKEVTDRKEFCAKHFSEPVYIQLHSEDLYERTDGSAFDKKHFYAHPDMYKSAFSPYAACTDVLINCMFWDPHAPQLFDKDNVANDDFKMLTIADVSCDVDGSVPLTTQVTSIEDPVFGYHRFNKKIGKPYQADTIDVMAVPNLPNELPKDASRDFGVVMMENILPKYLQNTEDAIFKRATIAQDGKLTEKFSYLQDYVDEL